MDEPEDDIATLADQERITDPSTIYNNIESLPERWQEAVWEFESHDLRPYQSSRLVDGTIVQPLLDQLENRYDADIKIKAKNPESDGE